MKSCLAVVLTNMLAAVPAHAVIIECNAPRTAVHTWSAVTLSGTTWAKILDENGEEDTAAEAQTTLLRKIVVEGQPTTTVSVWGPAGKVAVDGIVSGSTAVTGMNQSSATRSIMLVHETSFGWFSQEASMEIGGRNSASIDVASVADLGKTNAGETPSIKITSNGTGNATMLFIPSDFDNNGYGLLKAKGGYSLTYTIDQTEWDSGTGEWIGGLGEHTIIAEKIPTTAPSGKYAGSVTATLACQ